jgi:hypothetical protein
LVPGIRNALRRHRVHQAGLANALLLQQLLAEVVDVLQATPNLPDHIPLAPKVFKPNPFN